MNIRQLPTLSSTIVNAKPERRRWKAAGILTSMAFALLLGNPLSGYSHNQPVRVSVTGDLRLWHRVTVTFNILETSETAKTNPFRDYRLMVTFTNGERSYTVPGYYAADGNAGETGAAAGNKWRVHFTPDRVGPWLFTVSFRKGKDVAVSLDPNAGKPYLFNNRAKGGFVVKQSDKNGRDHRAKGMLRYVGEHYLQFGNSDRFFLKGGADSPENFLAYADFDDTKPTHHYKPHLKDWNPGDPTWRKGKGKGIIGALNYLSSKGVNSVYFLTMNVKGDGKDVWPWIKPNVRDRFDCSKLDQWETVFSHMDKMGIMLHVITQEQENDQLLDGGALGIERKLYYRELVARFSHHLAVTWNLGEENTNTHQQRKQFCKYIRELDPYDHPIVVHTFPGRYDQIYTPLLGFPHFEGPSLQTNQTHQQTLKWRKASAQSGRKWVVCLDEIGPAHTGVKPDKDDYWHDEVRKKHLWGNLMAGGAGCEWYFGYKYAHNDLNLEDFRSRDHLWDLTRYALEFFQQHLPFKVMEPHDELTASKQAYCFADPGEVYAIYLPNGGSTKLNLTEGAFNVSWYNPRQGGKLTNGSVTRIQGPSSVPVGQPPADAKKDWVILIRRAK